MLAEWRTGGVNGKYYQKTVKDVCLLVLFRETEILLICNILYTAFYKLNMDHL